MSRDLPVCYFPDTGQPVPAVLTVEDLVRFLRLDLVGVKHPERTIERYRKMGHLRGVQVGKRIVYYLVDVLAFIERQREALAAG